MKGTIPGANVKVFGKAIHSLAKIGEELYFEPLDHGLALRTVSSSRAAYACFLFAPSFFLHYEDGRDQAEDSDSEESALRCKLNMKSCLNVFRSLSSLEKMVEKCCIKMNVQEARLVFQLHCRHGIVKTHNLAFIECETLQAVFSKDVSPNVLTAQTRLLCDTVVNFQTNQEEVSLIATPEKVCLKNYVEEEPDPTKVIHTEMMLPAEEFDSYQVQSDADITFCLKELRAILSFSESANLPVSMHFESAGKPIVFSINGDSSFEADFVLATLVDASSQVSCTQQSTQLSSSIRQQNRQQNKPKTVRTPSTVTRKQVHPGTQDNAANNGPGAEKGPTFPVDRRKQKDRAAEFESSYAELDDGDLDLATSHAESMLKSKRSSRVNENGAARSDSPEIPLQKVPKKVMCHDGVRGPGDRQRTALTCSDTENEDDDDGDEEEVPGTPPSKKFKSMFKGLSQSTTGGSQHSVSVLAEETDEEDDL